MPSPYDNTRPTVERETVEDRMREKCSTCGAVGHGNATCRACVQQWPRFGIPRATVAGLLIAIGDRLPDRPFGTLLN